MKGAKTPIKTGYTIIEVMIVLAVSGMMLLIASNFINGKEESVSFPQGVNQFASELQGILKQVSSGQYSDIPLSCTASSGRISISNGSGSTTTNDPNHINDTQGNQSACEFIGKIAHFKVIDIFGKLHPENYEVFSLAGLRLDSLNQPITADVGATTPLDNDDPTVIPALTVSKKMPQSINVTDMGIEPVSSNPTLSALTTHSYGIGFFQSLGSIGSPSTTGSQPFSLYYIDNIASDMTSANAEININTGILTHLGGGHILSLPTSDEFLICVTDQVQSAYVTLGGANNQFDVKVIMLGRKQCT